MEIQTDFQALSLQFSSYASKWGTMGHTNCRCHIAGVLGKRILNYHNSPPWNKAILGWFLTPSARCNFQPGGTEYLLLPHWNGWMDENINVHVYLYIYIYIYTHVRACVCVHLLQWIIVDPNPRWSIHNYPVTLQWSNVAEWAISFEWSFKWENNPTE